MATIIYKCKRRPKYSGMFSFGNSKLPHTTAVFSITSATDCPAKKRGLCQITKFTDAGRKHRCYAMTTERMFPKTALVWKRKQAAYWNKVSALKFVQDLLNAGARRNMNALRLNESGDFKCQADVKKADEIAGLLKLFGIPTYCYTARADLNFAKCGHLVVNTSGFHAVGVSGVFLAVKHEEDKPFNFGVCCGDCIRCRRCIVGKNTVVILH